MQQHGGQRCRLLNSSVSVHTWCPLLHCLFQAAKMCTHGSQLLIVEQSCQSAVGVPFNTLVSYRLRRCATTHETKLLIVEQSCQSAAGVPFNTLACYRL